MKTRVRSGFPQRSTLVDYSCPISDILCQTPLSLLLCPSLNNVRVMKKMRERGGGVGGWGGVVWMAETGKVEFYCVILVRPMVSSALQSVTRGIQRKTRVLRTAIRHGIQRACLLKSLIIGVLC